jgi:hypothetical protein
MKRIALLLLGISIFAAAQSPDTRPFIPISGRILSATTGEPIPNAVVHYRGGGDVSESNRAISPPTLQGDVKTGVDGSYATPPLPAFGDFIISATAPGFFAAKDYLQAIPASDIDREPPPLPPGMKRPPGYKPVIHDGTLRLQPDPVDLRPMSDNALRVFAMPATPYSGYSDRIYFKGAFSADAGRLQFTTLESSTDTKLITRRCRAWIYDLSTGVLTGTERPGSPYVASLQDPNWPPDFCPDRATLDANVTDDRHFSVSENYDDATGRGACGKLVSKSTITHRTLTIASACPGFSFRTDLTRDLVFYTQPTQNNYVRNENIVEFNLATGKRRAFPIPVMHEEPQLLAESSLTSGAIRIAYTVKGDCDPAASDYSQPGQPDGVLGNTPNQSSVCFITIPAEGHRSK